MMKRFRLSATINETLIIRRIERNDLDQLVMMYEYTSSTSLYARYLRHHMPSREELNKLCNLSPEIGICLIAVIDSPGQPIGGVAHYVIHPENSLLAEPAILVADAYQQCGIGRALLMQLCELAVIDGVRCFESVVYGNNRTVFGLLRRCHLHFTSRYTYGSFEVKIEL